MKALSKVLKMQNKFDRIARQILGDVDGFNPCVFKVIGYSEAYTSIETDRLGNKKTYKYPETIEIKFENWSNSFYSVRVSDLKWIREGQDLGGAGSSGMRVLLKQIKELKAFKQHRAGGKAGA